MKNKTSVGAGCFHHLLSWGYKLSSIASPFENCDCELSWLNFKAQLVLLVAEPNHFNYALTAIIGWCRQVSKSLTLLVDDIARISVQFSHSFMSDSLPPHGLQNTRLFCSWNSLGKNAGVGSHSLLQRIFPTQGLNLGLLHFGQILCHLSHKKPSQPSI